MSRAIHRRPENIALGVITIVMTAFAMAFGDALVKSVSSDFTVWQIYVVRSLLAIPLSMALLLPGRQAVRIRPESLGWVFLRSLLLVAMWIAFYAALPFLSLSVIAAAYYTGPLFITLFSAALIGEPVGPRRWLSISIGFLGVLVILRPGTDAFSYMTLLPIVSALFYALAAVVTRSRCLGERALVLSLALNVSFLAVGAIGTVAIVLWDPNSSESAAHPFLFGGWTAMGMREWGIIAVLAILIVAISSGVAKAYQSAPPAIIATFDYTYLVFAYTYLVFAAFWGFVIFSESPGAVTVIGMGLIAGAGLLAIGWSGTKCGALRADPTG